MSIWVTQIPREPSRDEYLAHYGVMGMKWGVRRYQPYQKGDGQKSKGKFIGKTKRAKKTVAPKKVRGKRTVAEQKKLDNKASVSALAGTVAQMGLGMLPGQIGQLISAGAMSTPVGVAAVAGQKIVQGVLDSGLASAKIDTLRGKNKWPEDKALAGKKSVKEIESTVVPGVNPDYGSLGTTNNCRRATMAYELRRRGINVEARKTAFASGQTDGGMVRALGEGKNIAGGVGERVQTGLQGMLSKVSGGRIETPLYDYKKQMKTDNKLSNIKDETNLWERFNLATGNPTTIDSYVKDTTKKIFDGLAKQPDGSRGELAVYWLSGGGHSVAYEIIGGKPVIFDTQNGKTYQSPKDLQKAQWATSSAQFTRLDNQEFDKNYVERWVKDA